MNLNFRTLTAREIEVRIQQVKPNGLILLLYKDARCDMAILDETVGPMNWQRHHDRDNANCIVSIYDDEKKEWISKEDTGTESNTEAAKGLASDSFKRACVNWGIGRELYTSPFIWVPAAKCSITGGKCYDKFSVGAIEYNKFREISYLVIINDTTGSVCYTFGTAASQAAGQRNPKQLPEQKPAEQPKMTSDDIMSTVKAIANGITDIESANKALETIVSMNIPPELSRSVNQILTVATSSAGLTYSKSAKGYVRK